MAKRVFRPGRDKYDQDDGDVHDRDADDDHVHDGDGDDDHVHDSDGNDAHDNNYKKIPLLSRCLPRFHQLSLFSKKIVGNAKKNYFSLLRLILLEVVKIFSENNWWVKHDHHLDRCAYFHR